MLAEQRRQVGLETIEDFTWLIQRNVITTEAKLQLGNQCRARDYDRDVLVIWSGGDGETPGPK